MQWMTAIAIALAVPATSKPSTVLRARPGIAVTTAAQHGVVTPMPGKAFYYLPASAIEGRPVLLLVVLPGTKGSAKEMVALLRPAAEAKGFALLGVDPGPTGNFDAIEQFFDDRDAGRKSAFRDWPTPKFGGDARRLDRALSDMFERTSVSRVGLLGFSHGGSYALSIGLANPDLFSTIAALSPGLLLLPPLAKGGRQSVFLAHGRADAAQPYRRTACVMVPKLKALGYKVQFMARPGGHGMDNDELLAAIGDFLGNSAAGSTPDPADC